MNIIIAGGGEVGRHAAEVLGADHNVIVIDTSARKLRAIEETADLRTIRGNAAHAEVLQQAGAERCELFIAATNIDEINLLAAAVAKGMGAKKCLARVHHRAFFDKRILNYAGHLDIHDLICPEYLTAMEIARALRSPGALAIERFAREQIEMQQLPVDGEMSLTGVPLAGIELPKGVRVAMVTREGRSFIPDRTTCIEPHDIVSLIGRPDVLSQAQGRFGQEKPKRQLVAIMGGSTLGVWLCRALRKRHFSVRLFVGERERAEELAEKLEHVTVIHGDPTDPATFGEEHLEDIDAFVALTDDDERNLLACAQAKSLGARSAIVVLQRATYLHLVQHVGIDRAFSPRAVAVREILRAIDDGPVRRMASLAEGEADVYEIRPGARSKVIGKELRNIKMPEQCMIAAIQRADDVRVPVAEDKITAEDVVVVIGPHGAEAELRKLFVK
jgi:trk system potassium uptake protein TrkA